MLQKYPAMSRLLRFPLTRIVLASLFVLSAVTIVQFLARLVRVEPHGVLAAVLTLLLAGSACASYAGYVRWVERRPVRELAGRSAAAELLVGLGIGALLFATTMLILRLTGACAIGRGDHWSAVGDTLAAAVAAGCVEEVLARAVVFRILDESLGSVAALAISAGLFGFAHAFNPGATVLSSIAIALEAGVLLAAAFLTTGRLWLPIGMHVAWNFTEGGVFGANISGSAAKGLLSSQCTGANLLTGGSFGPEASLVAVVVCLAAGVALLELARRRGRLTPFLARRR